MSNKPLNPRLWQTNVSGCRFMPILFSTQMVDAILEGRKTQTRRIFKVNKTQISHPQENVFWDKEMGEAVYTSLGGQSWWNCPYGNVGDILWVRETWQETTWLHPSDENYGYIYKASENGREWAANDESWTWEPSLFMPKDACRLFLEITNIRIERLQDISANDIKSEGVSYTIDYYPNFLELWENLWVKINGQQSWQDNPFVWVIEFKQVECPYGFR